MEESDAGKLIQHYSYPSHKVLESLDMGWIMSCLKRPRYPHKEGTKVNWLAKVSAVASVNR